MGKLDPSKMTQAWKSGVSSSGQKWLDGINSQTENPAAKAVASADLWANNTLAAKQKFIDSLNGVSLAYIQKQANAVGSTKFTSGASKGESKYSNYASQAASYISSVKSSLPPRGDFNQNMARSAAMAQGMKQFKLSRRSI